MPLISIITVTYNAGEFLDRTLQSIHNQTCKDFEVILVDGGSTDNTLQIAQKYSGFISKNLSEPDRGIYDAMNKGLSLATGTFVWFINAGDEIASDTIVEEISEKLKPESDLLYGDCLFVNSAGNVRGKRSELTPHKIHAAVTWRDMKYGMLVSHQSLLVKRTLAPLYDINNLSADVDWEIECFKRAQKIVFLDKPISRYLEGGVSNKRLKTSLKDRFLVLQKHFGVINNLINHIYILLRGLNLIFRNRGRYW